MPLIFAKIERSCLEDVSYEPRHAKKCLSAYADREGPDQTVHPRSLIRDFAVRKQNHRMLQCFNGEEMPG